jgi:hypothetical protein
MSDLLNNLEQARPLVVDYNENKYFRGLVSSKLGNERRLDDNDDLIDLVTESDVLESIYKDLFETQIGRARIKTAASELKSTSTTLDAETLRILVWDLAVDDPRFDMLLKQAIEDSKVPPLPVRGSNLSRVSSLLEKIRSALASGAARHSNAVLAGSVAAGLVAGSAATKVAAPLFAHSESTATARVDMDGVANSIDSLTTELKRNDGSGVELRLAEIDADLKQIKIPQKPPTESPDLADIQAQLTLLAKQLGTLKIAPDPPADFRTRVANLEASVQSLDKRSLELDTKIAKQLATELKTMNEQLIAISAALRGPSSDHTQQSTVVAELISMNQKLNSIDAGTLTSLNLRQGTVVKLLRVGPPVDVPLTFASGSCSLRFTLSSVDTDLVSVALGGSPAQSSQGLEPCGLTPSRQISIGRSVKKVTWTAAPPVGAAKVLLIRIRTIKRSLTQAPQGVELQVETQQLPS